jgi:hypothetical protein
MLWFSALFLKDYFEFGSLPVFVHVTLLCLQLKKKNLKFTVSQKSRETLQTLPVDVIVLFN